MPKQARTITDRCKAFINLKILSKKSFTVTKTQLVNVGMSRDDPLWFSSLDVHLRAKKWTIESFDETNVKISPIVQPVLNVRGPYISTKFKKAIIHYFTLVDCEEFHMRVDKMLELGLVRPPDSISLIHVISHCFNSPKIAFQIYGYDSVYFFLRKKEDFVEPPKKKKKVKQIFGSEIGPGMLVGTEFEI